MTARIWLIEGDDESCRVMCQGRELASGLSEDSALRLVRKKYFRGDKVYRVDPDGYRRSVLMRP